MSAEPINLRSVRKRKAREERAKKAESNRAKFGESKAARDLRRAEQKLAAAKLESHKRDD